ncbi:hypothetical protein DFJ77DRAFT_474863 [Powellomyces hirtus]|nr:hypothetical protein DFJ77DRAFT_474863 [Powellomyces hirtus]
MNSLLPVASAAEKVGGPAGSMIPNPTWTHHHMRRSMPATPSQVEEVYAKITPTRLRQPPVRTPISIEKQHVPSPLHNNAATEADDNKSPLENRPPWNADFHVNRKDFSKPKLTPRVDPLSPSASKLPQPAGMARAVAVHQLMEADHHMLRSRSLTNMRASLGEYQTSTPQRTSEPYSPRHTPQNNALPPPTQKPAEPSSDNQTQVLMSELNAAKEQVKELESRLAAETKKRTDMEAEYIKSEAEILKAWETEFEQRRKLAKELESSQILYTEVNDSIVEISAELETIRGDLKIFESVLTPEQREEISLELAKRNILIGREPVENGDSDEIDNLSRRLEGLENRL